MVTLLAATAPPMIYVLYKLIYNYFSNQFFQKNLPELPIVEGQRPLVGHLHLMLGPRGWRHQQDGHKKLGKTYGLYLGNQRSISTIDLDFIKKIAVDQDHHDRLFKFAIAFEEFEIDCVATAQDEQWRRIRKALAPAFS